MKTIRIKCPVCGTVLEVPDDPANAEKSVRCPNCRQRNPFKDFKSVAPRPLPPEEDETQTEKMRDDEAGYLWDRVTDRRYPLRKGKQLVGRRPHNKPPKADIAIETEDQGISREHLYIDVMAGRDGRFHVYVSNARNKNATEINGKKLKDGDILGLRHGDVIRMNETPLTYIGTPIDDKTVTT